MKRLSIFKKVFISHLAIGVIAVVGLALLFSIFFERAVIDRTIEQLSSINVLKRRHIEEYFKEVRRNAHIDFRIQNSASWFGPVAVQSRIIDLAAIQKRYDAESMTLLDEQLQIMATTGRDTSLIKSQAAFSIKEDTATFKVIDVSAVSGSDKTEIAYAIAIRSLTGKRIGSVLIQERPEKIQNILRERTGMGTTGESYLVGSDFRMRSASRFDPDKAPLRIAARTKSVTNAFGGLYGGGIVDDYRNIKVVSYSGKLGWPAPDWVLVSEIDHEEAMQPVREWRLSILMATITLVIITLVVSYLIAKSISKPIRYLKDVIGQLSLGVIPDDEVRITSGDEVSEIAGALNELIKGWRRTTQFAGETGAGNFQADFMTLSADDTLGKALVNMRDQLRLLSDQKIRLVREKTASLIDGQEQERRRVAQELHDGVGQLLTVIRLRLQTLESGSEILSLVNDTIVEVRRISYNLMPTSIVDFGLEAALRGLCDEIQKISGAEIEFNYVHEFEHVVRFDVSIAVYRIIQEGLNNILKHAQATQIELTVIDREDQIYLLIKDNGKGFEPDGSNSYGLGLRIMEERTTLLEGKFELHTHPGDGTVLEVTIPLNGK